MEFSTSHLLLRLLARLADLPGHLCAALLELANSLLIPSEISGVLHGSHAKMLHCGGQLCTNSMYAVTTREPWITMSAVGAPGF